MKRSNTIAPEMGKAREKAAVCDDGEDHAGVSNVLERVSVEKNEIAELSVFHGSETVFHSQEPRGVRRRRTESFRRRESRLDEDLQLFVQAETGEDVDSGRGIGAREKRNSGAVHLGDELQLLRDEFSSRRQVVDVEFVDDLVGELFPGPGFPGRGGVLGQRIVVEISFFDQTSTPLPHERRALPGFVLREEPDELHRSCGVEALEELSRSLGALEELVLQKRAPFEDADEMLEALLSGIGSFRGPHRVGYVAHEGNAELLGFVGDREHRLPWNQRLKLDEVGAPALQVAHGASAIVGIRDGDRAREARLGTVEHFPGNDESRTRDDPQRYFFPPLQQDVEIAPHVADAGDSVGDEERERDLPPAGEPVSKYRMDVHVPQSGDEKLARGVHDLCPGREADRAALFDLRDMVALDDDRHVREGESPGDVDDGDVAQSERGLRRLPRDR